MQIALTVKFASRGKILRVYPFGIPDQKYHRSAIAAEPKMYALEHLIAGGDMKIRTTIALLLGFSSAVIVQAQGPRPTLADASPRVTEMNDGHPVDCTAAKVKIRFGSGRGEGYCEAVLAELIKSWESGEDISKLDTLIPSDKMPKPPANAFELKGDKLGSSMAEYLQHHPNDCVAEFSTPPEMHHSVITGNMLENTHYQHVNAFQFECQNFDPVWARRTYSLLALSTALNTASLVEQPLTIASLKMDNEQVEFSHQRLYRITYNFNHDFFGLIEAAFTQKFGSPTTNQKGAVQNGFGAQFSRGTVVWKNGVSTITLYEVAGMDLTESRIELTFDETYSAVLQHAGGKFAQAVQKDM